MSDFDFTDFCEIILEIIANCLNVKVIVSILALSVIGAIIYFGLQ